MPKFHFREHAPILGDHDFDFGKGNRLTGEPGDIAGDMDRLAPGRGNLDIYKPNPGNLHAVLVSLIKGRTWRLIVNQPPQKIESLEEARPSQLSGFFSFTLELLYG